VMEESSAIEKDEEEKTNMGLVEEEVPVVC
jgi:hypothetical protein